MDNNNIKPRLLWVDTAKGICILLVILVHTTENILSDFPQISIMLFFVLQQRYTFHRNPQTFPPADMCAPSAACPFFT